MKDTIVLYPALGRGHLASMVELGKLIAAHHPSFSITILTPTPPNSNTTCATTEQYIAALCAATPSFTFHHLPPPPFSSSTTTLPPHMLSIEHSLLVNHHVHQFLHSISKTSNLKAIVMDFLNYHATQVTDTSLNIPNYFYYTSGASSLAVLLQFPAILESTTKSFKDLHMQLRIPGLRRISTEDLPDETHERESKANNIFCDIANVMGEGVGIIVNTFEAIEGRAIRALSEGYTTPKVFCVGPVTSDDPSEEDDKGCLSWLDTQPSQSVVLLSFGSLGRFSKAQLKEIAIGLERSEQRFLWVVRAESDGANPEPSLDELLPEGFIERTKEKGMVVRNWAPQTGILSHDSVGGFVTHCGWNSVLEAVCEGVPMVAWPLYAEQKLNKVIMVQEMKVALALNKSKDGFVSGTELGERLKELMESDKGKEIRQRIFKMKMSAKEAKAEGGSSHVTLNRLAQCWRSS